MDTSYLPTQSNLINVRNTVKLASKGQELLDRKKNILIREMLDYIEKAKKIQEKANTLFAESYLSLQSANIDIGIENVMEIGERVYVEDSVEFKLKSIMGVEIPIVKYENREVKPHYEFYNTTVAVDKATVQFEELKKIIIDLCEIENVIYRLATNVQKVQKRSNALKNIIVPKNKELEHLIQNAIEEREREDFARLKVIKHRKNKCDG